jgi:CheY-like chemotaxis protein
MSDTPATILVVDDDEFTAELTGMILEAAGYGVVIAVGGMEAMEKMAEDPAIRMVVSDMNMPFIGGVQLFAELREHGYNQPFVLLTGDEAAPLRIAHPDMDAVVTKDEDLQEVLPKLVEAIFSRN